MGTDSELQNNVDATTEERTDTGETRDVIYCRRRRVPHEESNPSVRERERREEETREQRWNRHIGPAGQKQKSRTGKQDVRKEE